MSAKLDWTLRRLLVALVATSGALAAPLASFAQPPAKVWRVGVLYAGSKGRRDLQYTAFFEALRRGLINSDELEKAETELANWIERDRNRFSSKKE